MFVLYFIIWMIISSRVGIDVAAVGGAVSIIVYLFVRKQMRYKPMSTRIVARNLLNGVRYAGILVWETAKANLTVLQIVFSRSITIKPRLVYLRVNLKTDIARVVLANSITLTPGTITAELDDNKFCIHCLDEGMDDGIEDSVFVRELRRFEE